MDHENIDATPVPDVTNTAPAPASPAPGVTNVPAAVQAAGMSAPISPVGSRQLRPALQAFYNAALGAGRQAVVYGDRVLVLPLPVGAINYSVVPESGGQYLEDSSGRLVALTLAGEPLFDVFAPACTTAACTTAAGSSGMVRLRGDELVTFSGNKKEAETFKFLAQRLFSAHNLSVQAYATRMFVDEARTWVVKLLQAHNARGTELTWDALWHEFTACYLYDRFPNWEIRQTLFSRKYVQKLRQSVPEYMTDFHHTVLLADDLSETDQVSWFLAGLVPDIAAECQTDRNNKPYSTLQDLYEAARAVELRLIAQGKRQVQGAPSHLTTALTGALNGAASGAGLHRTRNAVIQKKGTNPAHGCKRPFSNSQYASRGGGTFGRSAGRHNPGRGRSVGRHDQTSPHSAALIDWIDWCHRHGPRCIRCGGLGHWSTGCPATQRLTSAQWEAFKASHPD